MADLVYPPLCLECNQPLEQESRIFCVTCTQLLVPIDPEERCPLCFSADFNVQHERCCYQCRKEPLSIDRVAAVFDYTGPPATLIKHLKYGGQSYLAKGGGAYLAAQFIRLGWPMPDCIIPMPMSTLRVAERGYNQSLLLAKFLGKLLERPVYDILERRMGDFSQAGLNFQQRKQLKNASFTVRKGTKLYDQNVLLIDDVMTTGSSLRCCAEVLHELYPQHIYALTVCRAME